VEKLSFEQTRRTQSLEIIEFDSTTEVKPLSHIIGQDRGMSALRFGIDLKGRGYNIYVAGPSGTGKKTAIINYLNDIAKSQPTPSDWCYVYNFEDPRRPKALELPAGKGIELRENMKWFVQQARETLEKAFSSEEYSKMRSQQLRRVENEIGEITEQMKKISLGEGFKLEMTPVGMRIIPIIDGAEISNEDFLKLSLDAQEFIHLKRDATQGKLNSMLVQFAEIGKNADEAMEELDKSVASSSLEHIFQMMIDLYEGINNVQGYLEAVKGDILDNMPALLSKEEKADLTDALMRRYVVNLLVDNSELKGAPVVTEPHPTHRHIFGYLEKEAKQGVLSTDFTLVRAGSAHMANGGFLLITVDDLFGDPYVWGAMKRTIRDEKLEIEDIPEPMEHLSTKILTPEPIPFSSKVILVGETHNYFRLYERDRDFKELFKVRADFTTSMERNDEKVSNYIRFISAIVQKECLLPFDRKAMAAIIEYGSRLAGDQKKLSTRFGEIADFIIEVSYHATKDGASVATRRHVMRALEQRIYHSNLYEERLEEMMERGFLLLDTEGMKIGQVNGLAVLTIGNYSFGKPSRVTASVGVGREGIVDSEREAELGGSIHTKGVQIIIGYLNEMYANENPLGLTARLVFEQSYSGIEGDSASSTELYALLSALSAAPIRQNLAVTGSVNQKGEIQAIGGVNEKVEGFFDVCKSRGLDGEHGVLIPASNVENLMLKEEIAEAVSEGKFHIYPVKTIDKGIEILTGVEAGKRLPDGTFAETSINGRVQKRLMQMAERIKEYSR
jgi:lon-related putative ATP-dependent protease